VITTSLHITIGEQVPKLFAISRAEQMARTVARPLHWFTISFRPFVSALNGTSNAILRLLRVEPAAAFQEGGTPEDLKLLITQSLEGGQLAPDEALMLAGVFELHELQARQVMTPITRVVMVDFEANAEAAASLCIESGHTRLVVTEDSNPDRVRGVIHANSLLRLIIFEGPRASIKPVVRDALIFPETKPLDTLLAELRRTRNTIAVVLDEYGRTAGIVAIEDIVEEIVGEIADDTDPAAGPVQRVKDGEWLIRGDVSLADLTDHGINLGADSERYNSVAGLVFDRIGHLPRPGDEAAVDAFTLTIESVKENRIDLVRVSQQGGSPAPPTD
jgi:CBS domain containing-hemolysin-like protein